MRNKFIDFLRCPSCKSALRFGDDLIQHEGEIESGTLKCVACMADFPIIRGIPRFVPAQNYADNFGMQWNIYRKTQLDSHSGHPISRDRFERFTGWRPSDMRDDLVLDVGCGAGRFAEVAISGGAHVVAIDFSNAIDAAKENLAGRGEIDLVQADAASLPFALDLFDRIYCLGVIQHTPNPARTFESLAAHTRPGGMLAIDVYPANWKNIFFAKYWIRPITRRLSAARGHRIAKALFPILYPVSRAIRLIPRAGHYLKYLIPVVNYEGVYPLNPAQLREWALLDTFDMWAPAHDQPQTMSTIRNWFENAAFKDITVFHHGFYVGRGTKREG